MVVPLGQQYNIGEKPTVILYSYINRHAGTPEKKLFQIFFAQERQFVVLLLLILLYYCIITINRMPGRDGHTLSTLSTVFRKRVQPL